MYKLFHCHSQELSINQTQEFQHKSEGGGGEALQAKFTEKLTVRGVMDFFFGEVEKKYLDEEVVKRRKNIKKSEHVPSDWKGS